MNVRTCLLIFLGIAACLFSCTKSTVEDIVPDRGYEYFPLAVGQSKEFAVDSIVFDPAQFRTAIDTFSGFLRETVVDTLRDHTGALVFRIERFYRRNAADPWTFHSVVSSGRNEQEAFFTEDNLRYVKLRFPLKTDVEWDATAYFPETTKLEVAGETLEFFKGWKSIVREKQAQYDLEGQQFSDVYLVELADFENKIEYRYGMEAYAPGAGLIYQEIWVMDTQCEFCCNRDLGACDPLPWVDKAEKGIILKKRLLL